MVRSVLLAAATAGEGSGTTALVVLAVAIVVLWLLSLWLHPYTHCRACKGAPRSYGAIFKKSFDLCRTCGGSGRRVRWGARMFGRNQDIS